MERTKDHPLINIIIAICAVICGADTWVDIENFSKVKQDWLGEFLDLTNGIPSHDTFGRVFGLLDPEQFQRGFMSWIRVVSDITGGEIVAIDGKQLRQSHNGRLGKAAIYMISAWAVSNLFAYYGHRVSPASEVCISLCGSRLLYTTGMLLNISRVQISEDDLHCPQHLILLNHQ
ncbi:MAG: ISAs1 family transposase [Chloroflexi bacterium]|nr:ISAs1 family transposase [Chloroflexota bacterium]